MPIRLLDTAEPLSPVARATAEDPIPLIPTVLAKCETYVRLCEEMERYARGKIAGRSFLIAGHRGAGKTTLVRWAIQETMRAVAGDSNAARPLMISLHGPDLLGGSAAIRPADPPAQKNQGDDTPAAPAPKAPHPPSKVAGSDDITVPALRMLTQAIHRAYADELAQRFWEGSATSESQEIVAQLKCDLDYAPDLRSLRWMWNRDDRLTAGVLFPRVTLRQGQGLRELIALSSIIEAHVRVTANVEANDDLATESKQTQEIVAKSEWTAKTLVNPLIGVLSGGAVGAGILTGTTATGAAGGMAAALAAVLVSVITTMTLNKTTTRSSGYSRSGKRSIKWDTSINSLDQMLPSLVDRLYQARIAPIFVVDELDKVPDLENKMESLISHLKHVVTEKAFFCFLADRSYFEHINAKARIGYVKESTFFSHRSFVSYRPGEMHQYLDRLLGVYDSKDADNELQDKTLLPFLVLQRSKMHPIDLQRELGTLTSSGDDRFLAEDIQLRTGEIRSLPAYLNRIYMQAAIQISLDVGDLGRRLHSDPNFARFAYDALYYPSRSWESGAATLDASKEALIKHLAERSLSSEDTPKKPAPPPDAGPAIPTFDIFQNLPRRTANAPASSPASDAALSNPDADLLYNALRSLLHFLCHPDELTKMRAALAQPADSPYGRSPWTDVAQILPKEGMGILKHDENDSYSWVFDSYGMKCDARIQFTADEEGRASESVELIGALNDDLKKISENSVDLNRLASRIGLIEISPAWPTVAEAIGRFRAATEYASRKVDAGVINAYREMLERDANLIAHGFIIAAAIGAHLRGASFGDILDRAFSLLRDELNLQQLSLAEAEAALKPYEQDAIQANPEFQALLELANPLGDIEALARNLAAQVEAARRLFAQSPSPDNYIESRRVALLNHLRTGQPLAPVGLAELPLLDGKQYPPLSGDPAKITLKDYAAAVRLFAGIPLMLTLVRLGFWSEVQIHLGRLGPETVTVLSSSPAVPHPAGERVLLVIGGSTGPVVAGVVGESWVIIPKGQGSVAWTWTPSAQHAVLPVFRDDLSAVLSTLPPIDFTMALYEDLPDPSSQRTGTPSFLMSGAPVTGQPTIVNPQNLDDAVEQARRLRTKPAVT